MRRFNETCDDEHRVVGDGCSGDCSVECGYSCDPSTMTTMYAKQPVEMAFAREAKLVMMKMGTPMMVAVNPVQLRSGRSYWMASIPVQSL